ncbi:hypothetical protein [Baekduia soli]|nr:hypothetical protein [Baekduia soli]
MTPADDRLPVVLVVLDGLGDRPLPELGAAPRPRPPTRRCSTH